MKKRKPLQNPNIQGLLVLGVVLAIALTYFFNNRQPAQTVARPAAAHSPSPAALEAWQLGLQAQLAALPSATMTPEVSPTLYIPPTLPPVQVTVQVFNPSSIDGSAAPSPTPVSAPPSTAQFVEATPVPLPEGLEIGLAPLDFDNAEPKFQLPPEQIPLSAQPNDHFFLSRPIDVTANSRYLFYYPYGSGGAGWRIHHGLDMPNAVGEGVLAAGDGRVVWADRTFETAIDGDLEVYAAYGNVVVIEHDFGWRGQPVWTLYAHLDAMFVQTGDRVTMGDRIGLVGTTGAVSGPHVHFEVRVGRNSYYSTRNPLLWMAPYVGHGVIAGRVTDPRGAMVDNALVQLNQGGRVIDRTTTYVNPYAPEKRFWNVVPDDNWNENFVMGDIPAGNYQLVVVVEGERFFANVTVNTGITTFVEIDMGRPATPQALDTLQPTAIFPTPIPTAIPTATP